MRAPEFFTAFAAVTGLGLAAILMGTTVCERNRAAVLAATSLSVAAALTLVGVQVGMGWIAAALALAGALTLAWGWLERLLVWVVGPALVLAVHSAGSLLSPMLKSIPATGLLLVLLLVGCALTGLRLRRLRLRAWFADLGALSLFGGLALMAGPVLSMGWRRAAIAAEGQDPVIVSEPTLVWPLALAAAAFAAGLGWRLIAAGPPQVRVGRPIHAADEIGTPCVQVRREICRGNETVGLKSDLQQEV